MPDNEKTYHVEATITGPDGPKAIEGDFTVTEGGLPPPGELVVVFEAPEAGAVVAGQAQVRVRTSEPVAGVDVLLTNAGAPGEVVVGYAMVATDDPLAWEYELYVGLQESKPYDLVAQVGGAHVATIPIVVNNVPPPPDDEPPTITSQPEGVTIQEGQTATLAVEATGAEPLSFQWLEDSDPIEGQTSPMMQVSPGETTTYSVQVYNAHGGAVSDPATVTVVPHVDPPPVPEGVLAKDDVTWIGCNLLPSDLLLDFAYGGCAGQRIGDDLFIYASGNEVNQGSPIFKFKLPAEPGLVPQSAPRCTGSQYFLTPYLGEDGASKRGTWASSEYANATIDALSMEERTLRESRTTALLNPRLPGRIKRAITEHSQRRLSDLARARTSLRTFQRSFRKGAPAAAMGWWEFPMNMAVNGGLFWHEANKLLYVTYADTYNVAGRPDWGLVAIEFHPDGTTTCYGPWRFAGTRGDGVTKYGPHIGVWIQEAADGTMAISTSIGSGNVNYPWGSSLWSGCPFPTKHTPTGPTAPDLVFPKRHLYYPYMGDKIDSTGRATGPVMSFHRSLDHVIFEPLEGMTQNSVNVAHYGYSSWNEQDQIGGFAYLQVGDRAGWVFTGSWAGSPIQDPANCAAAHAWYSGGLYLVCAHGCPPIVDGITGPTTRAAFSSMHVIDPQRMITNAQGTTVDWQTEAAWQRNMNTDFPAMPTAGPEIVGKSRSFNAGHYDPVTRRWICISQGADSWTHWGARTALLQVLRVGP